MAERFMRKGTTKFYFVPTLADPDSAPVASVTGGTNMTPQIADVSGFSFSNSPISVPDMDSAFVGQISGEDTTENSQITFYELKDSTSLKAALAKGTEGWVVIFHSGLAGASPAAGDDYEAWEVEVASNARLYTAGNEAAQYLVGFTLRSAPVDGTVVA